MAADSKSPVCLGCRGTVRESTIAVSPHRAATNSKPGSSSAAICRVRFAAVLNFPLRRNIHAARRNVVSARFVQKRKSAGRFARRAGNQFQLKAAISRPIRCASVADWILRSLTEPSPFRATDPITIPLSICGRKSSGRSSTSELAEAEGISPEITTLPLALAPARQRPVELQFAAALGENA